MTFRTKLSALILAALGALCTLPAPAQQAKQPSQELPWPQSFELRGYDVRTYGFAVTQPGPIALDVKSQGAPVDVVLQGPSGQPLEQQGSGGVHIAAAATPQDVQRGVFWHVLIRLAAPAAQAGAQSSGNLGVQHPPADPQVVQQAAEALVARRHVRSAQERTQAGAQLRAQRDAIFNARLAAAEQELVQRRATIYQAQQPTIDAMRRQQAAATAATPQSSGISTRALARTPVYKAPSHPVITSLSAVAGVPGDGIIISGSGFGTSPGQVHFQIGPSLDMISAAGAWVDGQIFVPVPDPSVPDPSVGATAYNGVVSVVVGGVQSNLVPFHFSPIIDHRVIRIPTDYRLGNFANPEYQYYQGHAIIGRYTNNWVSGAAGDDKIFQTTVLQNGWTVEAPPTAYAFPGGEGGGISMVLARVGTNSPYIDVFSWVDTIWVNGGVFEYEFEVPIQGPRGMPDGVVCVAKPAPNTSCPNSQ